MKRNFSVESRENGFAFRIAVEVDCVLDRTQESTDQQGSVVVQPAAESVDAIMNSLSPRLQWILDAIRGDLAKQATDLTEIPLAARVAANNDQERNPAVSPADANGTFSAASRPQPSELESIRVEDWAGPVAGQTYLEENFRIPRSTLHRWQRKNEIIALQRGGRKHVFPLAQFVDGRPAAGIREVLSSIAHPRQAWLWLTRPSALLAGRVPIDMLRQDLVVEVTGAAMEFSSSTQQWF